MSGELKDTGRPTMADIAKLAGVSKITVSRALSGSGLVSAQTRDKVAALAAQHGYRLNVSARNLRLQRTHTIGVVVEMDPTPDRPMSDPYPLALLGGIAHELASVGYSLLLTTMQGLNSEAFRQADGVILLGQGAHDAAVHALDGSSAPRVVWGAPRAGQDYVVVGSDNHHGGAIAAERFLELGRRRLVFLGDPDHAEVAERQTGFAATLAAHGAQLVACRPSAFTFAAGVQAVRALIEHDRLAFDGVFASSDLLAMGAVRALIDHGRKVPDDVSVIGYDDTPLAGSFVPALTSVHQNWREGGALLAKLILDLIDGKPVRSQVLPATLTIRST